MEPLGEKIYEWMRCRDVEKLLRSVREQVSVPLILADMTLQVVAATEEVLSEPRWQEVCQNRCLPQDMQVLSMVRRSLLAGGALVERSDGQPPVICCAVAQEQRLLGCLLAPCGGGEPSREELDILSFTAELCALRMQQGLGYARYPRDMLEFFVMDLLEGKIANEAEILDRCRFFRWNLKTPYRVLTLRRREPIGAGREAVEELCRTLAKNFPDATLLRYGQELKMVLPVHDRTVQDRLLLQELTGVLGEHDLIAGVSQLASRVSSLHERYQQAEKALEMGRLLAGSGPLYYYDSYAVYYCLEICAKRIDLLQLCHYAVLKLESYDRENGTELLGTLHAYLSCHQNVGRAAARLYIHRNTLAKRLDRINDLIHVDFSDAETVFHLMFSYRILEYYGVTQMPSAYDDWMGKSPTLRHP